MSILQISLSNPIPSRSISSSSSFLSGETPFFLLTQFSRISLTTTTLPYKLPTISMGGGPRTFPGGVSKWQWKRMQAKKSKQLLKARLARERQIYEMRKRAELQAAVSELERPWEVVERAPTLFSASADEQVKALADRFQKPGGFDLWSEKDGPQLFDTVDGLPSSRFFPKGVVHSIKPYGRILNSSNRVDQFGENDGEIRVKRNELPNVSGNRNLVKGKYGKGSRRIGENEGEIRVKRNELFDDSRIENQTGNGVKSKFRKQLNSRNESGYNREEPRNGRTTNSRVIIRGSSTKSSRFNDSNSIQGSGRNDSGYNREEPRNGRTTNSRVIIRGSSTKSSRFNDSNSIRGSSANSSRFDDSNSIRGSSTQSRRFNDSNVEVYDLNLQKDGSYEFHKET